MPQFQAFLDAGAQSGTTAHLLRSRFKCLNIHPCSLSKVYLFPSYQRVWAVGEAAFEARSWRGGVIKDNELGLICQFCISMQVQAVCSELDQSWIALDAQRATRFRSVMSSREDTVF